MYTQRNRDPFYSSSKPGTSLGMLILVSALLFSSFIAWNDATSLTAQATWPNSPAEPPSANRFHFVEAFDSNVHRGATARTTWNLQEQTLILAYQDSIGQRHPVVAGLDNGALVVWQDLRNDDGDIFAQQIDPAGNRLWTNDLRINTDRPNGLRQVVQSAPRVASSYRASAQIAAIQQVQTAWIVWVDNRNGDPQIFLQQMRWINSADSPPDVELAWLEDLQISSVLTDTQQGAPTVAALTDGSALVAWHDNRSGSYAIYTQRIDPTGEQMWATDIAVSHSGGAAGSQQRQTDPAVAVDQQNLAYVAWLDRRNSSGDIYLQCLDSNGSLLWPDEVRLTTPALFTNRPPAISIMADGAVVAWTGTDGHIYGQRIDAKGLTQWGEAQRLSPISHNVATDTSPELHVVPASQPSNGLLSNEPNLILAWKRLQDGKLIYAHLTENGRTVENQPMLLGTKDAYLSNTFRQPQLVTVRDPAADNPTVDDPAADDPTARDSVMVVWADIGHDSSADVYAHRIDHLDGNPAWTQSVPVSEPLGAIEQKNPNALVVDGSTFVLWQDSRSGTPTLYMQRFSESGETLWSADQPLFNYRLDPSENLLADVVTDGQRLTVVWADAHSGHSQGYLKQVDLDGPLLHPQPISIQANLDAQPQFTPKVAVDGLGQLYVTWQEADEDGPIVMAQQRSVEGKLLQTTRVARGRQPDIAVTQDGRAQLTWLSVAGSDVDLYTKRINQLSDEGVTTEVVRVNHLEGVVDRFAQPEVEMDAQGTAHVVWVDKRDSGIYLQRLANGEETIWAEGLLINRTPGTFSASPSLAVDQNGQTAIAWQEFYQGETTIAIQQIDAQTDQHLWQSTFFDAPLVSVDARDAQQPVIALDTTHLSTQTFSVVWQDARSMNDDIYLQRLTEQGKPIWPQEIRIPPTEGYFAPVGMAESSTINMPINGQTIISATAVVVHELHGGSLAVELTNNGGAEWHRVKLGASHIFTTTGTDLRWRATLSANPVHFDQSPQVNQLSILYETAEIVESMHYIFLPIFVENVKS